MGSPGVCPLSLAPAPGRSGRRGHVFRRPVPQEGGEVALGDREIAPRFTVA